MEKKVRKLIGISVISILFTLLFSFTAMAAPDKPVNLKQISGDTNSVNITWDAVMGTRVYYDVQYSADNQKWYDKGIKYDNSVSINGLSTGKSYYVRVRSFESENSEEKSAWSAGKLVATAPKDVSKVTQTNASTDGMVLTWPSASGANRYKVCLREGNKDIKTYYVSSNTATIRGLKAGRNYNFRVFAQRAVTGFAATSAWGTDIYYAGTVPSAIGGFKIANFWGSLGEVKLEWSHQNSADGYQIEIYNDKNQKVEKTKNISGNSNAYLKMNAKSYYKIRIRGYVTVTGGNRYGAWSTIYGTNELKLDLTKSSKGCTASWNKVSGASYYSVYISKQPNSGFRKVADTKQSKYTITKYGSSSLKKGSTYYICVKAIKSVGTKKYANGYTSYRVNY